MVEGNSLFYALIYFVLVYMVMRWYYFQFKKYRGRFVEVNNDWIRLISKDIEDVITKEDLDCIIVAEHVQLLKVYNVTHLYTKDGRYYFFTDEIIKYKKFKEELQMKFYEKFIVREKLIIGFPDISKDFLLYNKYR